MRLLSKPTFFALPAILSLLSVSLLSPVAVALEIETNQVEETLETGVRSADSLESYNRAMHSFNQSLDKQLLRPAAQTYHDLTPDPIERGVSNFFSNLGEPLNALNNLLQGNPGDFVTSIGRLSFNSTFGLYGILDVATEMGMEEKEEDFGQTLAVWGIGSGPYIVLPVLGPSTLRDTVGLTVDTTIGNSVTINDQYAFNALNEQKSSEETALQGVKLISIRADLLDKKEILDTASFDDYSFIRDAYLQKRQNLILDGKIQLEELPEELFE